MKIDGWDGTPAKALRRHAWRGILARFRNGEHVSDADLAHALRTMSDDAPFPIEIREQIAGRLDGTIKRPSKGRPRGTRTRKTPQSLREAAVQLYEQMYGYHPRLGAAMDYADTIKRKVKGIYGRTQGVHALAVERAAKRFGYTSEDELNYLDRELRRRKRAR